MVLIKIISGVYGHNVNGFIEAKDKRSEPFFVDEKTAERLVDKKVAVIIESVQKKAEEVFTEAKNTVEVNEEELGKLTKKELEAMCEEYGIDTAQLKNKADFIREIMDYAEMNAEEADGFSDE